MAQSWAEETAISCAAAMSVTQHIVAKNMHDCAIQVSDRMINLIPELCPAIDKSFPVKAYSNSQARVSSRGVSLVYHGLNRPARMAPILPEKIFLFACHTRPCDKFEICFVEKKATRLLFWIL